jgi:RNA polymerase sigma-70 factor (ECF subfamily)
LGRGDELSRFRELYDRTYDRLWAFAKRRIDDDDAIADVVAETYLAVWRRIRDVPADSRMADAWVFATAYRVLSNQRRGNRRRTALIGRLAQRPVDEVVDISSNTEPDSPLAQALRHIRPKEREILALRFWDDFDTDQIARIMGCTKNAAAVRLTRAITALRNAFDDGRSGEGGGQ